VPDDDRYSVAQPGRSPVGSASKTDSPLGLLLLHESIISFKWHGRLFLFVDWFVSSPRDMFETGKFPSSLQCGQQV